MQTVDNFVLTDNISFVYGELKILLAMPSTLLVAAHMLITSMPMIL